MKAKTFAKMFSLDRTDIINDDLGAFNDLRTRLGRGAAKKFNRVFWTAFMNNSTFFTGARGNYITGANTTLLTDFVGLELAIIAFDALTTPLVPPATVAQKVGGEAKVLLVPSELEPTALRLMTAVAATTVDETNIRAGKYTPVKAAQLSDSSYAGNSKTAWFLLRDPQVYPAMVVSLLGGNPNPTVESADATFERLGIDFRGYHDFGCDLAEWVCGVKSKGAA